MINNDEMLALLRQFANIHPVEGFEPTSYLKTFNNPDTEEPYCDYPAKVLLGWFRMANPDGRIEVRTKKEGDAFVSQARVYKSYKDEEPNFLSEATVQRTPDQNRPADYARTWSQTAALSYALELAGFGVNPFSREFTLPSDPGGTPPASTAPESAGKTSGGAPGQTDDLTRESGASSAPSAMQEESPLDKARKMLCPITKHKNKTLGELISFDPGALAWLAKDYKGDPAVKEAAQMLCEHALKASA